MAGECPPRGDARPGYGPPTRGVQHWSPSSPTRSAAAVVDDRHARPVPFIADSGCLDQAHDTLPVTAPWLEQLHHPVVVDALADQGPTHRLAGVEVADAHRIRIAVRALHRFGSGPDADSGNAAQLAQRVRDRVVDGALERLSDACDAHHRVGALGADAR